MSIEEKYKALQTSRHFHEARAEEIRFEDNAPRIVIFPSNWSELMKDEDYTYIDSSKKEKVGTKTIYYVFSPNSINAQILRKMPATPGLNNKITQCLKQALDEGWDGPIIATIVMKKGDGFVAWSVQGQKYHEDLPDTHKGWQKQNDSKTS